MNPDMAKQYSNQGGHPTNHCMKLSRFFFLVLAPLFFAACGSIAPVPQDTAGIVVGPNELRECGQGKVQFPAGLYQAVVVSPKGTYYLAPQAIRTKGVLLGRAERGGIFISSMPGNPQALWFGDLNANVDEKPSTLLGAIGVKAPKLWPYTPQISFKVKK